MVLPRSFFDRPALRVARDLIGTYLVRRVDGKTTAYLITETEAYIGPQDLASHSSKGRTARTEVMFGPPGHFYVYFTYGIHWMLNIVTGKEGHAAAVLLRGVEGIPGPARLTKRLKIDKGLNGKAAVRKSGLWFEERGVMIAARRIKRTPRIGVDYAGEWAKKPYRFMVVPQPKKN